MLDIVLTTRNENFIRLDKIRRRENLQSIMQFIIFDSGALNYNNVETTNVVDMSLMSWVFNLMH